MEIKLRQTCDDLLSLSWCVKSTMIRIAEEHGLTPVQLFALQAILHDGNTMGHLADTMRCDASNVTGVVDRLVLQGLVVRAESESDRRTKLLSLTKEGERTIRGIIDALPERLGCDRLSNQERHALRDILAKLTATV